MAEKQRIMCLTPGRATPGMVLAKPISDLLAEETVLDSDMLERLIRRGVGILWVCVPDHRSEEEIAREIASVFARIDKSFRGQGNRARSQLRDAVLNYWIERTR